MNKKFFLNTIGYTLIFSAGIAVGGIIDNPEPTQEPFSVTAEENSKKETLPPIAGDREYRLKIEDGVIKQYARDDEGIFVYEKTLKYIDINSIDSEFEKLLTEGIVFADYIALAEFIENLDS